MLEHPRLALKAEVLAELSRQRTEAGRLAAEAARRVAAGEAAVKQAEQLAGTEERILELNTELPEKDEVTPIVGGHRVDGVKGTYESLKKESHVASHPRKKRCTRGDEQGKVASMKEGHDVERDSAERDDVAKETASSRKKLTSLGRPV